MRKLISFLRGVCVLEICGGSPENALNRLAERCIPFWNVRWIDVVTVRVTVFASDHKNAVQAAENAICDCRFVNRSGAMLELRKFLQRPVLVGTLFCSIVSAILLSQFVLFYEVVGNERVSDTQIIRCMQDLGIGFGQYGPSIRPHWIKNRLLNEIPQLQWVTVTQNGCKAQIVVRERPEREDVQPRKGLANVIARESGIITEQSVFAGQAVHKVGDAVNKGELLVSGIVDLDRTYLVEYAQAEIFARTWRKKDVVIPADYLKKTGETDRKYCIWLVVGKSRIKIFGNSGISCAGCDKMITKRALSLPDNLYLPISLEVERFLEYSSELAALSAEMAVEIAEDYCIALAEQQIQAGAVLSVDSRVKPHGNAYYGAVILECHEMIAESIPAKWNNEDLSQ